MLHEFGLIISNKIYRVATEKNPCYFIGDNLALTNRAIIIIALDTKTILKNKLSLIIPKDDSIFHIFKSVPVILINDLKIY